MAELVYATDSKSVGRKALRVRVSPPAQLCITSCPAYDGCVQYPKPGKYVHFKHPDRVYEVLGIGRHSESGEEFVIYRPLGGDTPTERAFWIRPAAMFLETVERDGYHGPRFRAVGSDVEGLSDS